MVTGFRSKFYQVYGEKILPEFRNLERKRRIICTRIILTDIVIILLTIVLYHFFLLILPLWILAVFVAIAAMSYESMLFKSDLKDKCMKSIMAAFEDVTWVPATFNFGFLNHYNKNLYSDVSIDIPSTNLFGTTNSLEYNTVNYDDIFVGKYNDVRFTIAETELKYISGTGKNKTNVKIFKGILITFPANKTIKADTIINPKNSNNINSYKNKYIIMPTIAAAYFVLIGIILGAYYLLTFAVIWWVMYMISFMHFHKKRKFKKVNLEDIDFEKDFSVISKDQIEGRYLITPAFMDRFKKLQQVFKTKEIRCSFYKNNISFAISSNKDMFEIGDLWHSLLDSKQMQQFFDEITAVMDMIELFKLDEKTGL